MQWEDIPWWDLGLVTKVESTDLIFLNTCVLRPPVSLETFQLRGLYLIYPKEKGLYLGVGMGLVNEKELLDHVSASIEGSLGYQWNNNLFLEATYYGSPFKNICSQGLVGPYHWL